MAVAGSAATNESFSYMTSDAAGNIFMVWYDSINQAPANVYMQIITPSGTLLFGATPHTVCAESGDQYAYQILLDAAGTGALVIFEGPNENGINTVFVQHVADQSSGGGGNELPPADNGWIVAVVIIVVVAGVVVLLFFLDKKGIINLKPFFEKIKALFTNKN